MGMPLPPSEELTMAGLPVSPEASAEPSLDATLAAETGTPRREFDPFAMRAGPTRLGHHVLLYVLGRGGMGIVYAAYDEKLDRKVAIKLLLGRGGPTVQRRLAREAQALARLSHPNVVQIYEIGEYQDLAFLVMEFIDGVTLKDFLAEAPRSRTQVLTTFAAAGRGLAAAHVQGLIHRDFKPENVMIRRDGRVVVMDFGLARGADTHEHDPFPLEPGLERSNELSQQLTLTGNLTGTPSYMAPEQFLGAETDARTDQFSFCIALWEALYGERPFRGDNLGALLLAVTEGERVEPSQGDVPMWLRRVLERGLAREPAARWPAMPDLLAALERDPTRRRRGVAAAIGVVALTLAGVVGGQIRQTHQREQAIATCEFEGRAITEDWNETVAAQLEQAFLATEARFAASAWSHARPWMDAYAQSWTELRTQACTEARVEKTRSEASLDALNECLDQRKATFVALIDTWADLDGKSVAQAPVAAAELQPISGCAEQLHARQPPPESIHEQVAALHVAIEQARAMSLMGQYELGLARAAAILTQAEALEWLPLVAEAKLLVARFQTKRGDHTEARASAESAFLDAVRSGDDLDMQAASADLAYLIGNRLRDPEVGQYWAEISMRLIERLELSGTLHEAKVLDGLGMIHAARSEFTLAVADQQAVLTIRENLLGPEHPEVATSHTNLGFVLASKGEHARALEHFQRALVIKEATLGSDHPDFATAINNIGVSQMVDGQYADSLASFERALTVREAAFGPNHPEVAHTLDNIGFVACTLGQTAEAKRALERALELFEAAYGPNNRHLIAPLNNLGLVFVSAGEDERALEQFRKALAISAAQHVGDTPDVAGTLLNIADVMLERSAWAEAEIGYKRALDCLAMTPEHPWIGLAKSGLGRVAVEAGDWERARVLLDEALEIETRTGAEPIELARTQFARARLAWVQGNVADGRALGEAARGHALAAGAVGKRWLVKIDAWLADPN